MCESRSDRVTLPTRRVVALIAFLALAAGALASGRAAEGPAPPNLEDFLKRLGFEAIDYVWKDRAPMVSGQLGGKKRSFLLDTGWSFTTLNERTARGLKTLGELDVKVDDSFAGRLSNPNLVLMEELTLGRATFLNQPAYKIKLEPGSARSLRDGVLGLDFLYRNHCLVALDGRHLYVRASAPSETVKTSLVTSLRLSGMLEVPMEGRFGNTVEVEINDQKVKLLVDTGSFATVVDISQAGRLGLTHLRRYPGAMMVGVAGSEELLVSDVKSFRIATQTWKGVQVGVGDLSKWGVGRPGKRDQEFKGLLGVELLDGHFALIDFCNHRLWFRPGP
jgi:predicted aspartyl protease